jgi:ABC-2 type transport system ATP-binding protein
MTQTVLEMRGVRKAFGSVRALDGLDLAVRQGHVHGFLGPNGAGKTTTIRILLGLLRRDAGEALLWGLDPWSDSRAVHARLAYVPGEVTWWPSLSGGETIDAIGRLRPGFDPEQRDSLIERFDLDPTRKMSAYSKGNRQKVTLIAALACRCDLYVLDEPTDGLDPLMAEVFRDVVRDLRDEGRTVLLSSHVLAEVDAVCDRVSIIRAGRIIEDGDLAEVRRLAHTVAVARVARPEDLADLAGMSARVSGNTVEAELASGDVPAFLAALAPAGVLALEVRPPSVEELFLRYYDREQ